jgi:hypothetical protein
MHEEESAFLRNMGECLDGFWEEVVGFPPGGVKGVGGVRCWGELCLPMERPW